MSEFIPVTLYEAFTNTDLTEGRGFKKVLAVCYSRTTALRLVEGKGVQGTNGHVEEVIGYEHNNRIYSRTTIVPPTEKDKEIDEDNRKYKEALDKAKKLGLSEEEMDIIMRMRYGKVS